jgi:hypothetical protein
MPHQLPSPRADVGVGVAKLYKVLDFWREHRIDTDPDRFIPDSPVISISRQQDLVSCRIGDYVSITIEVQGRAGGKRGTARSS